MNIYQAIANMRKTMKMLDYTKEQIDKVTNKVKDSNSYEEAMNIIKSFAHHV